MSSSLFTDFRTIVNTILQNDMKLLGKLLINGKYISVLHKCAIKFADRENSEDEEIKEIVAIANELKEFKFHEIEIFNVGFDSKLMTTKSSVLDVLINNYHEPLFLILDYVLNINDLLYCYVVALFKDKTDIIRFYIHHNSNRLNLYGIVLKYDYFVEWLDIFWNEGLKPYSAELYLYAFANKSKENIEWLYEHKCPMTKRIRDEIMDLDLPFEIKIKALIT